MFHNSERKENYIIWSKIQSFLSVTTNVHITKITIIGTLGRMNSEGSNPVECVKLQTDFHYCGMIQRR